MKYEKFWCVVQTVQKGKDKNQPGAGIKLLESTLIPYTSVAIFPDKGQARAFLAEMIASVKSGIKHGLRSKGNLDPDAVGGLDFLILPVKLVEIDDEPMIKRGWNLKREEIKNG